MIDEHTVFILGAGASVPYGFPSGKALTDHICDTIQEARADVANLFNPLAADIIEQFAEELRGSRTSIDVWLGTNGKFENYQNIGKFLMARFLCRKESPNAFDEAYRGNDDWYGKLWNRLRPPSLEALSANAVAFITFNYDRSLEEALMRMVRNTFRTATIKQCAEQIMRIPIIHVHGQLGRLPWQRDSELLEGMPSRPYSGIPNLALELNCGGHIRLVGDNDSETEKRFVQARTELKRAKRIHFLGFGYLQ